MLIDAENLAGNVNLLRGDKGIEFRNNICSLILKNNVRELLKLDFKNVEVVDVSFSREAFVKLISVVKVDNERPQILYINVNDIVKQNLHQSFSYHNIFGLILNGKDDYQLIGKYSQQIYDTVMLMIKLKKASAKDLTKEIKDLELTTANNRLKSLYDMCVVTRKEFAQEIGGKEYIYYLK